MPDMDRTRTSASKPPRATRQAVAERAGVAVSTVSTVLNGRGDEFRLAPATQQRVLDAARELKYIPSAAARALVSQRSRIIGLAVSGIRHEVRTPVTSEVALSAVEQAQELGHFVLQMPVPGSAADADVAPLRDAGIAGLVCSVWGPAAPLGHQLVDAGFPVVWVEPNDSGEPRPDGSLIGIDPEVGVAQLAEHLWSSGRRSVAILMPETPDRPQLLAGRTAPLRSRFGAGARTVPVGGWSIEAGRAAMAAVLADDDDRPDAVFGANDLLACGALHACHAGGLSVPEEIAVAGYGDFPEAEATEPGLTTVSWPLRELGCHAVRTLIRYLDDEEPSTRHIKLSTALIQRASA